MFCGNGSSAGMATLLQQKTNNCMKTISNGGVVSGNGTGSSGSALNSNSSSTATSLQQTRILLPHEMVNLPSATNMSAGMCSVSASNFVNVSSSSGGGSFVITQQHNQQVIQPQQPAQSNNSHIQIANQVNHLNQFSRILTQNSFQDGNIIYMPATTINNIKNAPSTSSHILITNSASNVVTAVSTLSGGTVPLTVASLAQHNQNSSNYQQQQTASTQAHRDIVVTSSTVATAVSAATLKSNSTTTVSQSSQPYVNNSVASHNTANANSSQIGEDEDVVIVSSSDGYTNPGSSPTIDASIDMKKESLANGDIQTNNAVEAADPDADPDPEIDIVINNVVCSFSVRCHLNLREIALNGFNVEFRREHGMATMKLRRPYTTASIWSSGRITCTGATSEDQAKIAARRYARCLQKLGFNVRFHNFRVVNVLGTCSMPWAIKIVNFSERYKKEASYEPELHPGVTYKLKYPKATLKIFSTGSITVTAVSVAHVQAAIEHIFPLVYEFRKKRTLEDMEILRAKQAAAAAAAAAAHQDDAADIESHSPNPKRRKAPGIAENDPNEDIMYVSDVEEDDYEADNL